MLCLVVVFSAVQAQSSGAEKQQVFNYATDPDVVILSYSETPQMLANADTTPRIRVFGDGYVWVHYPVYMKRAGDYGFYLNPGEVVALLKSVSRGFDFDVRAVRKSRDNIRQARESQGGVGIYRSDSTLEEIRVNLSGYQATPGAATVAVNRSMAWADIAQDARDYPDIQALQSLNLARRDVRALLERSELVPLDISSDRQ